MINRAAIVARAEQHLGHREVAPNSSPLIDGWLRRCGVKPGLPWCAAFASWCVETREHGGRVACAGALRLGAMFPETRNPQLGDLCWFATDGKGAGHVGIVAAAVGLDEVICIEGNSGDRVRYVRRLRSQVKFSSTRNELAPLPEGTPLGAPFLAVSYDGTR